MKKYNYYRQINDKYGKDILFYCNGPFLIEISNTFGISSLSINVNDINPTEWKLDTEYLINSNKNAEALILSYRNILKKHCEDLKYLSYADTANKLLAEYDEHFHITSERHGKI